MENCRIASPAKLLTGCVLSLFLTACALQPQKEPAQVATQSGPEHTHPEPSHIETISLTAEETVTEYTDVGQARELAIEGSGEDQGAAVEAEPEVAEPATVEPIIAEPAPEIVVNEEIHLWHRVRSGFSLPDMEHKGVTASRNWYARNQAYLDRTFTRAEPYFYDIVKEVEERGMPLEIALLPVVESAFQPFAYSHGRAAGIWQFIPGTGRRFGLKINWWYDGRRDIRAATTAALDYLEFLHKEFDGDWLHALAAYNSGEGTVRKAIRRNLKRGKGTTFWDLKLPRETRGYVPKLLGIAAIVRDPKKYDITLKEIANEPRLTEVELGSQLDLAVAADLAGMSLEQLYILNPGFNRWATAPNGPHRLLLPLDIAEPFKEKLAALDKSDRVKWLRHRIREGESLGVIAHKYKTTVGTIKKVNKIRGNMIRAGKHLLIPTATKSKSSYALSADQRLKTKQNTPAAGRKVTHTVSNGDTLWDIAMAHKVSVRKLASWNGMAPRDTLRPGQTLVIWVKKGSKAAVAATLQQPDTALPLANARTQKINYRVRNGDSLARISQKFNVSVKKLKQWNPAARGKYIQPGQRLVVYVDITKIAENI